MEHFDINDFLGQLNRTTKKGICKSCGKSVSWERSRVASHKRSHCSALSSHERQQFAKRRHQQASGSESNFSEESSFTATQSVRPANQQLDEVIASFFFRTGISFRIADSAAFKKMIEFLNPDYAKCLPSSKVLSGRLLNAEYQKSSSKLQELLNGKSGLTLTSDGWTNIKGQHLVNYVIKAPGQKAMFYKCIDTTGIRQTGQAVAESIVEVIEKAGPENFSAFVSDNASVMRDAWKRIEEKYPQIAAYGCAAHALNLLVQDIAKSPEHVKTISETSKLIQFFKNHHQAHAKYSEHMSAAGVTHKLVTSVPTRFFSNYSSAVSVRDAKLRTS
jgi:hypothetical protein